MEKEIFDARYDKVREIRLALGDLMPSLQNGDCISTREGESLIVVDGFAMDTHNTILPISVWDEFGIRMDPKTYTNHLSPNNPRNWDIVFLYRFNKEKCNHTLIWGTEDNIGAVYYHENADDLYVKKV